jgi:general stress protein CsbA
MDVPSLKQKLFGSALTGALIFGSAYGAGTSQWWLTVTCSLGIGYMLGMTAKHKQKASMIAA